MWKETYLTRFIPTCVGNALTGQVTHLVLAVHPHMRGERDRLIHLSAAEPGSSPHAWGTQDQELSGVCSSTVHPHMRGERLYDLGVAGIPAGSSPHAWGTLLGTSIGIEADRFIPTCVGNAWRRAGVGSDGAVHPHMRGERLSPTPGPSTITGSSPHAWGTHREGKKRPFPERFIPTCVGNACQ